MFLNLETLVLELQRNMQGCHRSGLKHKDNCETKYCKKEQKLLNKMYSVISHISNWKRSASAILCPQRLSGACHCSSCLSLLSRARSTWLSFRWGCFFFWSTVPKQRRTPSPQRYCRLENTTKNKDAKSKQGHFLETRSEKFSKTLTFKMKTNRRNKEGMAVLVISYTS